MSLRAGLVGAALCAATWLAGCATPPPASPVPVIADAQAHQAQREAALAAHPDWSLQGRVAVSNGRDGGNGRIEWQQQQAAYRIELSAPVTRQGWRLSGDAVSAQLDGLPGGSRRGADPAQLLLEATGWRIPVSALGAWVRGAPAQTAWHGQAALVFGADGRLLRIEQDGWRIDYADWRAPAGQALELPHRLDATSGAAKVKLIVDAWQAASVASPATSASP